MHCIAKIASYCSLVWNFFQTWKVCIVSAKCRNEKVLCVLTFILSSNLGCECTNRYCTKLYGYSSRKIVLGTLSRWNSIKLNYSIRTPTIRIIIAPLCADSQSKQRCVSAVIDQHHCFIMWYTASILLVLSSVYNHSYLHIIMHDVRYGVWVMGYGIYIIWFMYCALFVRCRSEQSVGNWFCLHGTFRIIDFYVFWY